MAPKQIRRRPTARGCEAMEPRRLMSTYTVTTLADAAAAGQLTFRQAVADANAHAGADTVTVPPAWPAGPCRWRRDRSPSPTRPGRRP